MTDYFNAPHSLKGDISTDTLFDGELICYQYKNGYRFSIDAVLLAHFRQVSKDEVILDMGCGCGIIGLILAYRHRQKLKNIVCLEVQSELAEITQRNITDNGYHDLMTTVCGDLRHISNLFQAESFSSIICNPPFYAEASGRKSRNDQERIARHQVMAELGEIVSSAAYAVRNKGIVSFIYPADCMTELIYSMVCSRLQPKKMQLIYSYPYNGSSARLVILEAVKNGGPGLLVNPPFYIYQKKKGEYSCEMKRLYLPNEY